jgi:hypothetical protein
MDPAADQLRASAELPAPNAPDREDFHETVWPTASAPPMNPAVSDPSPGECVAQLAADLDALTAPTRP